MHRSIVLLRGINVGGHNRLPMADLRHVLARAGYSNVATYIQSGNAGVSSPRPAQGGEISRLLAESFDLEVPVVVVDSLDLAEIADANPFVEDEEDLTRLHVVFFDREPASTAIDRLEPAAFEPDRFHVEGRAMYVHYPEGTARSKLGIPEIEKALGVIATGRNMKTVERLRTL